MRWRDKEFAQLTAGELYALLALRQGVFVVEQTCPFLDTDGRDPQCHHLWAETAGEGLAGAPPVVLAYLRILPPGQPYAEVSIGRVVTAPAARGTGLGRQLMQRGLLLSRALHGPVAVRIGAQAHLERFYGEFGFVRASANYDEDGIPHLEMLRPAGVP